MQEIIQRFYPYAVPSNEFVRNTYRIINFNYGINPHQIMLAHSICSDDVNSIEYPEEGRQMLGPFNLGGLDGYPFTGVTGMSAFAHHVPEEGAALVFYAPHVGIGRHGCPGKIQRLGQHDDSTCCGALLKALDALKAGTISKEATDPLDYQQQTLESIIWKAKERIESAEDSVIEATDVILEESGKMIDQMIAKTEFMGKYLFVVGAVVINGDWTMGSFLELRRFDYLDPRTKKIIKSFNF
jgi:hypothetical protein